MGRKPKPQSVKALEGAQPCRQNTREPAPARRRPEPPSYLEGEALDEWVRITDVLDAQGVLTEADAFALGIYCEAFARKRQAEQELKLGCVVPTDAGGYKTSPAVGVIKGAEATMLRILASFGLTAVDRGRVSGRPEKKTDDLEGFLDRAQ